MSTEKRKYMVVLPWHKGQQVGEVFEAENLHPSLASHVREVGKQEPGLAERFKQLGEELKAAQAAQAKAEKALKDLQKHRAENPALDLQVATPAKAEATKPKK